MYLVKAEAGRSHARMARLEEVEAASEGGMVWLILEGWRRWKAHTLRERRRSAKRQLFILETIALGPKQRLVLMKCGEERFLVGTGADGVTSVVRVEAPLAGNQVPLAVNVDESRG